MAFRARQEGENLTSYLQAKQAFEISQTGSSTISFGSTPPAPSPVSAPAPAPVQQPVASQSSSSSTGYSLVNLGSGTYGAYNPSTQTGQAFSSEANAKSFFGGSVDYTKAIQPTFDVSRLLGVNADKMQSFATTPQVQPVTNNVPSTQTTPTLPPQTATENNTAFLEGLNSQVEAARKSLEDMYKKQREQIDKDRAEIEKRMNEYTTKQEETIDKSKDLTEPFRADLETKERERLKVEENYFANQNLVNELDTLLSEGNAVIKQMSEKTGLGAIRNPRINKTISDVNARAGVIQAVISARNGQIAQAYNLIDRSVSAISSDRIDELNYYKTLYNFYADLKTEDGKALVKLDDDDKTFLVAQMALVQNDLNQAQATANKIKDLMVSPESAYAMSQAGVTLNDSVSTINKKLADYTVKVKKEASYKENKTKLQTAGITTQFANVGGEIQRVADGYAFESLKDFQDKTGMTLAQAAALGMISDYKLTGTFKDYPTSYQEYLLAVKDGYKGSYNDYQTLDANRKAVRNSTTNITYNQQQDQNFQTDLKMTQNNLNSVKGSDNHVAPSSWKKAYDDWVGAGHTAKEFFENFKGYVNPKSKAPYFGITIKDGVVSY